MMCVCMMRACMMCACMMCVCMMRVYDVCVGVCVGVRSFSWKTNNFMTS